MNRIMIFICRIVGVFSKNKYALHQADMCLVYCQAAFFKRMHREYESAEYRQAWLEECFWSRAHDRYWRLAWRKPAFKKD